MASVDNIWEVLGTIVPSGAPFMQLKKYAERHDIVFPSLFSEIKLSEKGRVTPCPTIIFKSHIKRHRGREKELCILRLQTDILFHMSL